LPFRLRSERKRTLVYDWTISTHNRRDAIFEQVLVSVSLQSVLPMSLASIGTSQETGTTHYETETPNHGPGRLRKQLTENRGTHSSQGLRAVCALCHAVQLVSTVHGGVIGDHIVLDINDLQLDQEGSELS
jgi:hypothetical protein